MMFFYRYISVDGELVGMCYTRQMYGMTETHFNVENFWIHPQALPKRFMFVAKRHQISINMVFINYYNPDNCKTINVGAFELDFYEPRLKICKTGYIV